MGAREGEIFRTGLVPGSSEAGTRQSRYPLSSRPGTHQDVAHLGAQLAVGMPAIGQQPVHQRFRLRSPAGLASLLCIERLQAAQCAAG